MRNITDLRIQTTPLGWERMTHSSVDMTSLPETAVSAPLIDPLIGGTGNAAALPSASLRNWTVHCDPLTGPDRVAATALLHPDVLKTQIQAKRTWVMRT